MPDLKTFWTNPGMPAHDGLAGDSITSSGTDPQVDASGSAAVDPLWPAPPVPGIENAESPNSVSGLPPMPNRFEPSEQPPEPPSLQDRRPGTIDQQ
jgi:hypothetical protein